MADGSPTSTGTSFDLPCVRPCRRCGETSEFSPGAVANRDYRCRKCKAADAAQRRAAREARRAEALAGGLPLCLSCGGEFNPLPSEWNYCISCRRERARAWRAKRCAAGRPLKKTETREQKRAWQQKYQTKPEVRALRYARKKERALSPEQALRETARKLLRAAVRWGRVAIAPCEVCGAAKVEGHHDDYSQPLKVRWLCRPHHLEVHGMTAWPVAAEVRS